MATTPAERPDQPLAALVPTSGADEGAEIPIHTPVVRIGQGPQNDLTLDDDTVSTNHARLEFDTGSWRITDLESRNGTYLEGIRLAPGVPTPVNEGAVLGFGGVKLRFRTSEGVDVERARVDFVPEPDKPKLSERSTFRLPLWLVVMVVLVLALLIGLFVWFGGDPGAAEPVTQAMAATVGVVLPPPAA